MTVALLRSSCKQFCGCFLVGTFIGRSEDLKLANSHIEASLQKIEVKYLKGLELVLEAPINVGQLLAH